MLSNSQVCLRNLSNLCILSGGRWQFCRLEYSRSDILNSDCIFLLLTSLNHLSLKNWLSLPSLSKPWVLFPSTEIKMTVEGCCTLETWILEPQDGAGMCDLLGNFWNSSCVEELRAFLIKLPRNPVWKLS